MLLKKNDQMKIENEMLKQKYRNKRTGIFTLGLGLGALFVVVGNRLLNVDTMDKARYQIYKAKDKLKNTFNTTIDSFEEATDSIEKEFEEITKDDDSY